MSKNKTVANDFDVNNFVGEIKGENKKKDTKFLIELFEKITSEKPRMWGESIIGFGTYHYKYDSGREGDMFLAGFSPRAQNFSIYVMSGAKNYKLQLQNLGKHKIGKSCLYFKSIENLNIEILEEIITDSVKKIKTKYC